MKKLVSLLLAGFLLTCCGCDVLEPLRESPSTVVETPLPPTSTPPATEPEPTPEPVEPTPHEHLFVVEKQRMATCEVAGEIRSVCTLCEEKKIEETEALGHSFPEDTTSYARLLTCTREGCLEAKMPESEWVYAEKMRYTFSLEDIERIDGEYQALVDEIVAAGAYDKDLHAYAAGSELASAYTTMITKYNTFYRSIVKVGGQYQYAKIYFDVDSASEVRKEEYLTVSAYYNRLIGRYYGLYEPIANCAYREYFYYGETDAEIAATVAKYSGSGDTRYVELTNANNAIEVELGGLPNLSKSTVTLDLYEEFVQNNNEIAELFGCDNYMEYAYRYVYGREYLYTDSEVFYENVKRYIAPLYQYYQTQSIFAEMELLALPMQRQEVAMQQYLDVTSSSFFENVYANQTVNDFMEKVTLRRGNGKTLSYAEQLNELMRRGTCFRGTYQGAYMWTIAELGIPIVYFGSNYQEPFTLVHEFGHYANGLLNASYDQSFDLAETHSQGLEMLYLSYLSSVMTPEGYACVQASKIEECLWLICMSTAVNRFEQAVYTNTYEGKNASIIMADGSITKNEYDYLFANILEELGITKGYEYWRYVTIPSPAYYISYAVSMACSLQLYSEGMLAFDDAAEKYLKLVTYTDDAEKRYYTYKQVLEDAGLYAYDDLRLFEKISTL